MANEVRANGGLTITKNGDTATSTVTNTLDLTGSVYRQTVQTIGTSFEQATFTDMDDCKAIFIKNNSISSSVTCSYNLAGNMPFATLYGSSDERGLSFALFTPYTVSQSVFLKANQVNTDVTIVTTES